MQQSMYLEPKWLRWFQTPVTVVTYWCGFLCYNVVDNNGTGVTGWSYFLARTDFQLVILLLVILVSSISTIDLACLWAFWSQKRLDTSKTQKALTVQGEKWKVSGIFHHMICVWCWERSSLGDSPKPSWCLMVIKNLHAMQNSMYLEPKWLRWFQTPVAVVTF